MRLSYECWSMRVWMSFVHVPPTVLFHCCDWVYVQIKDMYIDYYLSQSQSNHFATSMKGRET